MIIHYYVFDHATMLLVCSYYCCREIKWSPHNTILYRQYVFSQTSFLHLCSINPIHQIFSVLSSYWHSNKDLAPPIFDYISYHMSDSSLEKEMKKYIASWKARRMKENFRGEIDVFKAFTHCTAPVTNCIVMLDYP